MEQPEEFLAVAEALIGHDSTTSQGSVRTAVDRAYYAAFHACIRFEKCLPLIGRLGNQSGGSHEDLIQRLERPDPKLHGDLQLVSRALGASLRQLKAERVRATYKLDVPFPYGDAVIAVLDAKRICAQTQAGEQRRIQLGANAKSLQKHSKATVFFQLFG
jgi:hypothetical protein